jgi:uncharacterized protein YggU (UPF0235/DUF167 family)
MRDDLLTVKVSAPPVEGAANKALIALLAEKLGVSKSSIDILSGESRLKLQYGLPRCSQVSNPL